MRIKALVLVAAFAIPTIASADDMNKSDMTDKSKATDKTKTTDKSKATAKLEADEVKIVAHHNHVNLMEIDMGKMAQKLGTAKVKSYGAMLVKDHTAANKQLTALAKKKGVAKIPADVPETEADKTEADNAMAAMDRIKKLKNAEFDREFLTMVIADHDKEVMKTELAITTAKDPDLVKFLQNVKPTLQKHADNARELQKASEVSSK